MVAGVLTLAALAWGPSPAGALPPNPSFTFSPSAPVTGQTITFDASSTTEPGGGTPVAYAWDFNNDGNFGDAAGIVVTHSFPAPGTYPVNLRVTGSDGVSNSVTTRNVAVALNRPPAAGFFASPTRPAVNEVVRFTSTSSDPDGRIMSHAWDLDADGRFDDAAGPAAFTAFTSPGTRLVSLRVVDDSGAATVSNVVLAVADPTVAQFPLMSPFPVVRLAGSLTRRGARIRILAVTAPAGSRVVVRCRSRRCPRRRVVTRTRRTGRPVRIRSFQRRLQAGVVLEVLVSRPGVIGKHTRFLIRRGRPPKRRDGCLLPGATTRSTCPG